MVGQPLRVFQLRRRDVMVRVSGGSCQRRLLAVSPVSVLGLTGVNSQSAGRHTVVMSRVSVVGCR